MLTSRFSALHDRVRWGRQYRHYHYHYLTSTTTITINATITTTTSINIATTNTTTTLSNCSPPGPLPSTTASAGAASTASPPGCASGPPGTPPAASRRAGCATRASGSASRSPPPLPSSHRPPATGARPSVGTAMLQAHPPRACGGPGTRCRRCRGSIGTTGPWRVSGHHPHAGCHRPSRVSRAMGAVGALRGPPDGARHVSHRRRHTPLVHVAQSAGWRLSPGPVQVKARVRAIRGQGPRPRRRRTVQALREGLHLPVRGGVQGVELGCQGAAHAEASGGGGAEGGLGADGEGGGVMMMNGGEGGLGRDGAVWECETHSVQRASGSPKGNGRAWYKDQIGLMRGNAY